MANISGDGGDNVLNGTAAADVLSGLDGDDLLFGLDGDDLLLGGFGDDDLDGGAGADEMNGGAGDDFLVSGEGVDLIDGGLDFDTLSFAGRIDAMTLNITNGFWAALEDGVKVADVTDVESVFGSQFADTFTVAADFFSDGESFINIRGLGGNDVIEALGALGDVTVRADYRGAFAGVVVDLGLGTARSAGPNDAAGVGVDTLIQVTQVRGSAFGDQLIGSDDDVFESFRPEAGNDFVDGRGGENRIDYRNTPAGVVVDMALELTLDDGFGFVDVFRNIQDVRGSAFDDDISGDDAVFNFFQPRAGNDVIDGRGGFDLVDYRFETTNGLIVSLGAVSTITGDANVGVDTLIDVEAVRGTVADDVFSADAAFQASFDGFNVFEGLAGDDAVNGNGSTRIEYDTATTGAIFADLAEGIVVGDASVGTDTVSGVFEVRGTAFDDALFGSDANPGAGFESFEGMAGDDLIVGRGGLDRVNYASSPTGVDVNLLTGVGFDGFGSVDTLFDIEGIKGSNFDDALVGDFGDNQFEPLLGADQIDGGAGVDELVFDDIATAVEIDLRFEIGRHANGDVLTIVDIENVVGGEADDDIVATSGDNVLIGGSGDDRLVGLAGADIIEGDGGADVMFGNSGDDILLGGEGDDRIVGGFGADDMQGGRGADIYFVDNTGDTIAELANGGVDIETVISTVTFTLAAAIENLSLDGATDIDGTGNGNSNALTGNDGANTLAGLGNGDVLAGAGGDDVMLGGNGDDVLIDGAGADRMNGGAGIDVFTLTVDGEAGNVVDDFASGVDLIDLIDFDFIDEIEALSFFSDVGADAVFAIAGVSYTFLGVATADIQLTDVIV